MLVQHGMRTTQLIGVPDGQDAATGAETDAVVVALKSRAAPVRDAVQQSLRALDWLRGAGCRQFFFKYCSTFDSTDEGNIGPVADALIDTLDCGFALACPAVPTNGRTVYQGHLFVGQTLLNESGMESHPVTPMRDASLVRMLSRQTEGTVGLVGFSTVEKGPEAIRLALTALKEQGRRYAIVDALTDRHLYEIGEAAATQTLITGGSGIAMGLAQNFRDAGLLPTREDAGALPSMKGHAAALVGSCSRASLLQIGRAREHMPTLELDPLATPDSAALTEQALAWASDKLAARPVDSPVANPVLITASAAPDRVLALQTRLGRARAGELVEETLALIAEGLVARGVRRLVLAGEETSRAIVTKLGVTSLQIGAEIDPAVPWTYARGTGPALHLALKSGNFGTPSFFIKAFARA
jgi:uncharacterized protein YgbK (DUF1537 family)